MSQTITITNENILTELKVSCKLPEIIEGIVTRKIIENAATEAGIKVEDEELQKVADQLRLANNLISADDTWEWLGKHGLSIEEFEQIIYNTVTSKKLATHLFGDKVEPYFFANQLHYSSVVMYEIILDDEDLAIELFYAVQEGEMSFYDVAHKYIQDTELRRKVGYRGILHRKDLKPEISAAVFAIQSSQLLKPIVTSSGIHLILVEEIIQPELNEKIRSNILSDLFFEWLKQQIEQTKFIQNL